MLSFIDGKYYAFDFDTIIKKCFGAKGQKKKDAMRLLEKEVLEDFEGNERLSASGRHVRELNVAEDTAQQDNIAYDLFKILSMPVIAGDFFMSTSVADDTMPGDDDELFTNIMINPGAAISFNTMLNEGFIKEIEVPEEDIEDKNN